MLPALAALLAALSPLPPAPLPAQGEGSRPPASALRKSDLVRFLTGTTYTKGEIAAIVQRSCLAFVPTPRDREDLQALGATDAIFNEIETCVRNGNRPAPAPRPAAAPPRPPRLTIVDDSVSAVAGTLAYITVRLERDDGPALGVRLTLTGATSIEGGARTPPTAMTDARGRAVFTVPAGTRAGTYRLGVRPAIDMPLQGGGTITLTTLPATPTLAGLSPSVLTVTPGSASGTQTVVATIADPFGNPVTRRAVELRTPAGREGLSPQTAQTSDSGVVRFEVPTASLRTGDTLYVATGGRIIGRIPVFVTAQMATQLLEAERRSAEGSPAAEAVYDSVLAADPGNITALLGRGYARSWAGKHDAARQDFQAALREDTARAAALTGLGYDDARRGDYSSAAEQFRQALRIAPRRADAATGLAYAELWRRDPHQAARRGDVLQPSPRPAPYPADAADQFREGIEQLTQRKFGQAVRTFSAVIAITSTWPEAYYNRALAYHADGQSARAIADFQKYLALRPAASNRSEVTRWIAALRMTPQIAIRRGLMLPGLGQVYTQRPVLGAAVFAGVVGSTVWGLHKTRTTETRRFRDIFGGEYTSEVTVEKRPHFTTGVAVAGTLWLLAAFEASLHADMEQSGIPLPIGGPRTARAENAARLVPVVALRPSGPAFGAGVVIPIR